MEGLIVGLLLEDLEKMFKPIFKYVAREVKKKCDKILNIDRGKDETIKYHPLRGIFLQNQIFGKVVTSSMPLSFVL